MADKKPFQAFMSDNPGFEQLGAVHGQCRVADSEGEFGGFSFDFLTQLKNGNGILMGIGGAYPYVAAAHTETKDNSSTIAMSATGLRFQTQASPSDNDDTTINSVKTVTLAAGMRLCAMFVINITSAANYGVIGGVITSSSTDPLGTAPNDGIYLVKAKDSAAMVLRIIENGNAADDLALGNLTDATDCRVTFKVKWNDDSTIGHAQCWVDGVAVQITADQLAALALMLTTTAPTLVAHAGFRVNGTTQRAGYVKAAYVELF